MLRPGKVTPLKPEGRIESEDASLIHDQEASQRASEEHMRSTPNNNSNTSRVRHLSCGLPAELQLEPFRSKKWLSPTSR